MSSVNTSLEQRDYNVIVQYNVQLTNNLVDVGLELIQHSVDDDHEVTILPTSMTSGILAGSEELPAGVFTSDTSLVLAAMSDAARGTSHFSCLAAIPHRGNNPRLICVYFDSQVTNTFLEQARRLARTMHKVWMESDEDNAELDDGQQRSAARRRGAANECRQRHRSQRNQSNRRALQAAADLD